MKILITGICGFVGSALAECLLERHEGISVSGIDNLMRPGSETNRTRLHKLGVTFVTGTFVRRATSSPCLRPTGSSTLRPIRACWPEYMGVSAVGSFSSTTFRV